VGWKNGTLCDAWPVRLVICFTLQDTYLAYIDESGSDGLIARGGSKTFSLGCVLIPADQWPNVFDSMLSYRRFLRDRFHIPIRAEIKANYLIRNGGALREHPLSERARAVVYRGLMRLQEKLGLKTFAVVIRKEQLEKYYPELNARVIAWEYLLQRLERFTSKGDKRLVIFHDDGEGGVARPLLRKARRIGTAGSAFGTGSLKVPARLLIDDAIPRKSHESYFIQLADLSAYAAFRCICAPPKRKENIVTESTWSELGSAIFADATKLKGGPAGIVVWP